jgi:uncharacterized protein GlcG (DUF336 family)
MNRHSRILRLAAAAVAVIAAAGIMIAAARPAPTMAADDVDKVLDQAEAAAKKEESLLRVNGEGKKQKTKMHMVVVDRDGKVVGQRSMPDAWQGSINIAKAKAFTSAAFSSDENALTTRTIGALTQPGGPLWNIGNSNRQDGIIEFPGGVPLYKGGKLMGAIGVSGDGVEQDENVAAAGSKGFEAPKAIRVDTVTNGGVPFTK